MPDVIRNDDGITDPNEYRQDKEEFANTLDAIFENEGKTDEEIRDQLDGNDGKTGEAGDATRDQSTPDNQQTEGLGNSDTTDTDKGNDGQASSNAPATDESDVNVDWKQRALDAEAAQKKMEQKMKSWDGRIRKANDRADAAEKKLAELDNTSQSEEDADDQQKIKKFKEEFPELGDVIDIYQKKIDKLSVASQKPVAQTDNTSDSDNFDNDPVENEPTEQASKPTDHYVATRKAHPDLDEIVSQGVLLTWINKQPTYIQPHLKKVYNAGDVQQVIDMVNEFKQQTGWKSQLADDSMDNKLKQQLAVNSEASGPGRHLDKPDKNDFDAAAKDAFKE